MSQQRIAVSPNCHLPLPQPSPAHPSPQPYVLAPSHLPTTHLHLHALTHAPPLAHSARPVSTASAGSMFVRLQLIMTRSSKRHMIRVHTTCSTWALNTQKVFIFSSSQKNFFLIQFIDLEVEPMVVMCGLYMRSLSLGWCAWTSNSSYNELLKVTPHSPDAFPVPFVTWSPTAHLSSRTCNSLS